MGAGRHRNRVWQRELRCGLKLVSLDEKLSRHQVMSINEIHMAGHDKYLARHHSNHSQDDYDSNDKVLNAHLLAFMG